jgi:hypothetical protein
LYRRRTVTDTTESSQRRWIIAQANFIRKRFAEFVAEAVVFPDRDAEADGNPKANGHPKPDAVAEPDAGSAQSYVSQRWFDFGG